MFDNIKNIGDNYLMHEVWDVPYDDKMMFDFYGPIKEKGPFPAIIYFHGGGIKDGSKAGLGGFCHEFIKKGYAFFSVEYPMYPNTKFPEYIKECAKAIKFISEHAKEYGCNDDIYIMGQSAGAYILLMLCCNKAYLKEVKFDENRVKGWISESGTCTDHITILEIEKGINPMCTRISEYSPIFYVQEGFKSSPILLTYNKDDQFLNRDNGNKILYNQIKYFSDVDIKIVELPGRHCAGTQVNPDGSYNFNKVVFDWLNR